MKALSSPRHLAVAVAMSGLVVGSAAWFGHSPVGRAHAVAPPASAPLGTPANPAMALPDFATLVERQGPAVVHVSVVGTVKTGTAGVDPDDPAHELLRRFGAVPRESTPRTGMGSGFIVSADGTILTNAHVVANAGEVTVKLTDKREFKARVVGIDKPTDVAVLKIDARDLPVVSIGDPRQSRVGDWVVAIGAPFGFENSVTSGIISAKSRALPEEGYVPFLQTDVAINPGNSGGPLFNLKGEVIGINSQIYSRSGGYQGLSFAIPIDIAMRVEKQLVAHGTVQRGRLGVTIQDLNQSLADSFGLDRPGGALVSSVEKDSPAAKAGVQPGDVILGIDGKAVGNSNELPPIVADMAPGAAAKLEIWRSGGRIEVPVAVGESKAAVAKADTPAPDKGRLGLAVRPLTPEEQRAGKFAGGLVVEQVAGPAKRAGVRPGDVVLAVNGAPIESVGQLQSAVAGAGKRLALLVQRKDGRIYVPVELG